MDFDQDYVPSTIESAINELYCAFTDEDLQYILITDFEQAYKRISNNIGKHIRNLWSLWVLESPLRIDAIRSYKIAHPDDISGLIIAGAIARIKGQKFSENEWCQRYHDHWKKSGMTSLQAGGLSDNKNDLED